MNLMEGMIAEVNRCKEDVIPAYEEIGPAGKIALALIRHTISRAEKAMGEGDTLAMLSLYKELQDIAL